MQEFIPPRNKYPQCMEYLGNNKYKCTENKFPIITVKPENLPIVCDLCPNKKQVNINSLADDDTIQYPGLFGLASNFGKAVINYAKSGFKNVTPEQYKNRLNICSTCEHYDNGRCKHVGCGCFLSTKAWLSSEKCPIDKWIDIRGFEMSNGEIYIPRQENPLSYIKTSKLIIDTYELVKILPTDIDIVVGSARSGMLPATTLACHYHRPLYSVDDAHMSYVGNGWRLKDFQLENPQKILLIEDTVYNGNTIDKCTNVIQNKYPNAQILKTVIYCHTRSLDHVNYYVAELNGNHYLEWNLFNSAMVQHAMIDFDGILCQDAKKEDDDDGEKYANFIKNAIPKNFVRRVPIRHIVTARMEKYRSETLYWLDKHGMKVEKLTMGNWEKLKHRTVQKVIDLKASEYLDSPLDIFVESCPYQAEEIFRITQKNVLCPEIGYVLSNNKSEN
jgi:hypoxanthine phosphoribosyltransferase